MIGTMDKLSQTQASEYLGVSRQKIWQLVRDGKLKVAGENPLDGRQKLFRLRDLEKLKRFVGEKKEQEQEAGE